MVKKKEERERGKILIVTLCSLSHFAPLSLTVATLAIKMILLIIIISLLSYS
jgi:hypothetical protein